MQVTYIKEGYDFVSVLPPKNILRAASVKINAKFSRVVPSCRIIYSVQNKIAIYTAIAFNWKTLNQVYISWSPQAVHYHIDILLVSYLCFIHNQKTF